MLISLPLTISPSQLYSFSIDIRTSQSDIPKIGQSSDSRKHVYSSILGNTSRFSTYCRTQWPLKTGVRPWVYSHIWLGVMVYVMGEMWPYLAWNNAFTLMLLVAKNLKNDRNLGTWVLIWEYSARAFQWIPIWQGLDVFQKSLHLCALDKRSCSIERVKMDSCSVALLRWQWWSKVGSCSPTWLAVISQGGIL